MYNLKFKRFFMLILFLSLIKIPLIAAIPIQINYQGILQDSSGNAVYGLVNLTFRIYDVETGGTPLWSETHNEISIDTTGYYSVKLGSINSLTSLKFDRIYYISMSVNSEEEMSPRQQLTVSPYANRANIADSISFTVIADWNNIINKPYIADTTVIENKITNYELRITNLESDSVTKTYVDSQLSVVSSQLSAADTADWSKITNKPYIPDTTNIENKITNYELRITNLESDSVSTENRVQSAESRITNLESDSVTKTYVNNQVSGISVPTKISDLTNDSGFLTLVPSAGIDTISANSRYLLKNTEDTITGNLKVIGTVNATAFVGDGSGLTGITGVTGIDTTSADLRYLSKTSNDTITGNLVVEGSIQGSSNVFLKEDTDAVIGFNYPDAIYDRRLRITAGKQDTFNNDQGASIDLHGTSNGSSLDLVAGRGGNLTFWSSPTGVTAQYRAVIDSGGNIGVAVDNAVTGQFQVGNDSFIVTKNGNVGLGTMSPFGLLDVRTSNGAGTVVVTSDSGYVGIGTTNPSYPLEIYSSGLNHLVLKSKGTGNAAISNIRALDNNDTGLWFIGDSWAANKNIAFSNMQTGGNFIIRTENTDRVTIDNTGNVGIGTTSPTQPLTVNGNVSILTGKLFLPDGAANAVSLTFGSNSAAGIFKAATNVIGISTANTERMRIDSVGNVGIGTTSPSDSLTINGSVKMNGGVTHKLISISGAYTVLDSDYYIKADATAGTFTITLPTAVGKQGKVYKIKKIDNVNTIIIDGNASETIDGQATVPLSVQWQYIELVSDGNNWMIWSIYIPLQ